MNPHLSRALAEQREAHTKRTTPKRAEKKASPAARKNDAPAPKEN